jgi:hypothetical protein
MLENWVLAEYKFMLIMMQIIMV